MCPLNVAMDTNTTSNITHIVATNNTIYYSYNNLSKYWVAKINHALKKRTKHKIVIWWSHMIPCMVIAITIYLFIKSGPFLQYFDFWSVIYYWHVGPSWFCLYGPIPIRERGSPCPLLRPFPPPSRFWWPPRRTVRILDYVSIHRNDVDGQPWRSTQSVVKASAGWRRCFATSGRGCCACRLSPPSHICHQGRSQNKRASGSYVENNRF